MLYNMDSYHGQAGHCVRRLHNHLCYNVDSYDGQAGHCVGRLHNYLCYIMWTAMMDKTGIVWDAYTMERWYDPVRTDLMEQQSA